MLALTHGSAFAVMFQLHCHNPAAFVQLPLYVYTPVSGSLVPYGEFSQLCGTPSVLTSMVRPWPKLALANDVRTSNETREMRIFVLLRSILADRLPATFDRSLSVCVYA